VLRREKWGTVVAPLCKARGVSARPAAVQQTDHNLSVLPGTFHYATCGHGPPKETQGRQWEEKGANCSDEIESD